MSKYRQTFFDQKRPWSVYKDLILDYYLKPYLAKVSHLGRPLLIVDMFAGRGRFKSGEDGSPLIIARRLSEVVSKGTAASLLCFEETPEFAKELRDNLREYSFASVVEDNCFQHIDRIAHEAASKTTFLYVDPCSVANIHMAKLGRVYERIRDMSSVEALVVFMAPAFVRQALALLSAETKLREIADADKFIQAFPVEEQAEWVYALWGRAETHNLDVRSARAEISAVAGGDYWEQVLLDTGPDYSERVRRIVEAYKQRMTEWFRLVASYPIRSTEDWANPKYWMILGSRYRPALDLFNRAACCARRQQGIEYARSADSLFASVPIDASVNPATADAKVLEVLRQSSPVAWKELRWQISLANTGLCTDTEINDAIKRLLSRGRIAGPSGRKIENEALLTLTTNKT